MTFYEHRFPADISGGAQGGPRRVTDVVELRSGHEERNSIWRHSRRRWDAATGVKSADDLAKVLEFWEAVGGRLHAFRWKDWLDYKSCRPGQTVTATDQAIGSGDGAKLQFQLVKIYAAGSASYSRPIRKPVAGTVKIAVAGIVQATGWTVDTTTGLVTFSSAPASGAAVTAGFEFDVPARFETDELSTLMEVYHAGAATIGIVEVKA